jgi:hypothetical protein
MQEEIQNIASGKVGLTMVGGTVSMPWWIEFIHTPVAQAMTFYIALFLSLSIFMVNMQTFIRWWKQSKRNVKNK